MPRKEEINYPAIDENIRDLVRAMNALPGIETLGSCGGHESPTTIQQPEGSWFVSFSVAFSPEGWRSLELIACLTSVGAVARDDGSLAFDTRVSVEVIQNYGYLDGCPMFDIYGRTGVCPRLVAQALIDLPDVAKANQEAWEAGRAAAKEQRERRRRERAERKHRNPELPLPVGEVGHA